MKDNLIRMDMQVRCNRHLQFSRFLTYMCTLYRMVLYSGVGGGARPHPPSTGTRPETGAAPFPFLFMVVLLTIVYWRFIHVTPGRTCVHSEAPAPVGPPTGHGHSEIGLNTKEIAWCFHVSKESRHDRDILHPRNLRATFSMPWSSTPPAYVLPADFFNMNMKPTLALVAILALLAMHDLCVAEVGLVVRTSMPSRYLKLDAGSREPAACGSSCFRQKLFNRHANAMSDACLVLSTAPCDTLVIIHDNYTFRMPSGELEVCMQQQV